MPTLHTLNKTTQDALLNKKLSNVIDEGDSVILIEDGVYQCLSLLTKTGKDTQAPEWAKHAMQIYALKDDALARGVSIEIEGISFISYEEFVQLSLSSNKVVSWY